MTRLIMALVATIAIASGQAYAGSGGPGIEHDDTTYPETESTWGGSVSFEGAVPFLASHDTNYPAAHTRIDKELLSAEESASLAMAHDTVYPAEEELGAETPIATSDR